MDYRILEMIKAVQRARTYKRINVCDNHTPNCCTDHLELSASKFKQKIVKKLWKLSEKYK
jgi:hypothetical protein